MSSVDGTQTPTWIGGEWRTLPESIEVRSSYSGELVGTVPSAGRAEVDEAVTAAQASLAQDAFPQHERAEVLERAAGLLARDIEDFARLIALEATKPIKTARVEAERAVGTFTYSAVEARRLAGEVVPMAGTAAGAGKLGITLRLPVGVVAAISPFNFPLNLVVHKVGPAIAAGAPIVLKPASATPLTALKLARLLEEAGLPGGFLNVVTGGGSAVGDPLVDHAEVKYVSFTGSAEVGWAIAGRAPKKRVRLELGSSSPLIVHEDGDWERAAKKAAVAAFSHAGQSCISTQRIYLHQSIKKDFLSTFLPLVDQLVLGDPLDEATDVSQLITEADRDRVLEWVREATSAGASVLAGGEVTPDGLLRPTVLGNVTPGMKVSCQEVFGPVVTTVAYDDITDAFALANGTPFGLQAGVYTSDLGLALRAGRELEFGGVMVNDVPTFRADQQPYGGVKDSGNTREGPRYAVEEMTEIRLLTLEA